MAQQSKSPNSRLHCNQNLLNWRSITVWLNPETPVTKTLESVIASSSPDFGPRLRSISGITSLGLSEVDEDSRNQREYHKMVNAQPLRVTNHAGMQSIFRSTRTTALDMMDVLILAVTSTYAASGHIIAAYGAKICAQPSIPSTQALNFTPLSPPFLKNPSLS